MKTRQILIAASCLLVGAAIIFLPRSSNTESETKSSASVASSETFKNQLEAIKKQTPAEILARVTFFENKLKENKGNDASTWLDSLVFIWDRQMRPGISAEYALQKAELIDDGPSWKNAGIRFLAISNFFEGNDKSGLLSRAIACLEKAQEKLPNDDAVKTQLGVAYVEGSAEPMKGIALLREAVAKDSNNLDAQISLGFFSMKSGQFDKAVKRFQTVMRLRPDLPEAGLYLAEAYQMDGKTDEALSVLDQILNASKDSALTAEIGRRKQNIISSKKP
jgi:cytochrome c-type biogenesis protein CcmH/NrfG